MKVAIKHLAPVIVLSLSRRSYFTIKTTKRCTRLKSADAGTVSYLTARSLGSRACRSAAKSDSRHIVAPETVDYTDPGIPPGFNAEKIDAGIAIGASKIAERGWQGDLCMIAPDDTAGPVLEKQLASAAYDCVVIGAGLKKSRSLPGYCKTLSGIASVNELATHK